MARRVLLLTAAMSFFLALAILAVPVKGEGPTVTVTSPQPGIVVEGSVLFQGNAEDPDGDLSSIIITIEGSNPAVKVNLPSAGTNATWEKTWNSQGAPDGLRRVSVVALDKAGQASQPVNFTLLVDNFKEPAFETARLLFDKAGDGSFSPWNDLEAVPTTRLRIELQFSEEMDEMAVRNSMTFSGGDVTWQLAPEGTGEAFSLNVSYLQVNTNYTLTVGTQATDLAGNPLQAPYELNFHTAEEATPGTPEQGGFLPLPFNPLWLWIGGAAGGGAAVGAVLWKKGFLHRMRDFLRRIPMPFRRRES
ncbi:MAG: Ig-like domain-containing protein [Thermoplasmata archaeon]